MQVGLRTAAWAASGGWEPYVRQGLAAWWDGHEAATTWVDKVGKSEMSCTGCTINATNVAIPKGIVASGICAAMNGLCTVEILIANFKKKQSSAFFTSDYVTLRQQNWNAASGKLYIKSYNRNGSRKELSTSESFNLNNILGITVRPYGRLYVNGVSKSLSLLSTESITGTGGFTLNGESEQSGVVLRVYGMRVYNRDLSADEIAANYADDVTYFGLT